jgi:4-diphosphocytidyl-2-C-methyl-D-erythritol kinase
MRSELYIRAPAKVNLHLEILGRRADGFHEIRSLFQMVSLHDRLRLRLAGGAGETRVTGRFDFPSERNTITRAAALFRAETGVREGIEFEVEKNIPAGGGFGGGSSDAAAALAALQALFELKIPADRMRAIASEVGSDVPFFLGGPAALVEGRGERLGLLKARVDYALVAVISTEGVSTPDAYRWIDEGWRHTRARGPSRRKLVRMYETWPVSEWRFFNSFDPAVFAKHPRLQGIRDAVLNAGALGCRLTGSGSGLIGIFSDAVSAESCAQRLKAIWRGQSERYAASVLAPLATIPDVCYD